MTRPARLSGILFSLGGGHAVVGRGAAAEIPLDDGYVSRAHALLTRTPEGYVVEDLASAGGTMVNGERLTGQRRLHHGDVLRFGPNVEARFEQLADVDETVVLPADSNATMNLPVLADPDLTLPVAPVAPVAPAAPAAPVAVPAPDPSPVPAATPARTAALSPVPRMPTVSYHQQVMVERDKALRRAARTRRRAAWLVIAGLLLLLAGGGTYGWVLLRYYTKVDPVTGAHPHTLRLFGDPVNGIAVGKIAFGVAVGGLALLMMGIVLRIVAGSRRRRARDLLVPMSAVSVPHPSPSPGQAPYGQAPYSQAPYDQAAYGQPPYDQAAYGQPQPGPPVPPPTYPPVPPPTYPPVSPPTYPPMTPIEPYPPRPGWPRL